MCGIAGILRTDGAPADAQAIHAMTRLIAHRGPDGEGHVVEGAVALGHRRLAIIDLTDDARQPMESADGRFSLTYNGELYNFKELREELCRAGYRFRSRSDTEVVLAALARWGAAALLRFNGMFAFGLWDRRERTLLLARDRFGVKPLYYTCTRQAFLFASEVKAFRGYPGFESRMDLPALLEYFTFQNLFSDRTLLDGVRLLPAGTTLTMRLDGAAAAAEPSIARYWDFCFEEPTAARSDADYLEELDSLFNRAVASQLVSDVDVGAYLSGGMDSGAITAVAARQIPYMRTFTCGFDLRSASGVELNFDERAAAEHQSYLSQTEHYEVVLKAGDMERVLPKLAWHLDEPRVGQSYPNYYVAQLASKFVKVVLAGTGGDELFGGYPWRYYRAVVNDDFEHYVDKYYVYWQRLVPNRRLRDLFAPVWPQVEGVWTRDIFRNVFASHASELTRPEDYVNHSLYFEAKTFLHGLLVVEDKLSMAHSLETRVPFLDNDLVDFAMRLPVRLKLRNLQEVVKLNENEAGAKSAQYYQRTNDGKLLLRDMVSRYVSSDVAAREKQGFSAPDASWFKGESIDYVRRRLFNGKARLYEFLDEDAVRNLVADHLDGRDNRRLLIWSLLNVEAWCDAYLA
jgi:asparagine synthase (glutamine-hydrolysing)